MNKQLFDQLFPDRAYEVMADSLSEAKQLMDILLEYEVFIPERTPNTETLRDLMNPSFLEDYKVSHIYLEGRTESYFIFPGYNCRNYSLDSCGYIEVTPVLASKVIEALSKGIITLPPRLKALQ